MNAATSLPRERPTGMPLEVQVGNVAASFGAKITSAIREQRLGCSSFTIDLAWLEQTEGGLVPTSYNE